MATKSSFILAILFIANPFMLLLFQNCSSAPHQQASSKIEPKASAKPVLDEFTKNN
ncbi:MAG: hypothetical protein H7061_09510 [Bdellovibrionaceae bacterium]|nr:hypothetical protein [Bdellovibrio sp.]